MRTFRKKMILAGFLAASMLCSCGIIPEEETFQEIPYVGDYEGEAFTLAQCIRMDIDVSETVPLKYMPLQTVTLDFDIGGVNYGNTYVQMGESVSEGELLMELDTEQLVENAETETRGIEACRRSVKKLEDERAIALKRIGLSRSSMTAAKYQESLNALNESYDLQKQELEDSITVSEIRLEKLNEQIEERRIYAPFDGVVTYVFQPEADERSQSGKRVITIADSSLSLFKGTSEYHSYFVQGQEMIVSSGGAEYEAVVCTEEELGLPETPHEPDKMGTVYLALKETVFSLSDKDKGSVQLTLEESRDTLCVPRRAVSEINGKSVVYCPDENGMKIYKEVEVGLTNGFYTEILSGLEEGEPVIIG